LTQRTRRFTKRTDSQKYLDPTLLSVTVIQLLHTVDAFTNRPFTGNPAAVCILPQPADESWMKLVAREMSLSETAFLHPVEDGFLLRWFTPTVEVKLCGHATLASAFTLWETGILKPDETARFSTLSGRLTCVREGEWIAMDFPAKECAACEPPSGLSDALGCDLLFCGSNGMDYLVEARDENTLRALLPNMSLLGQLPVRGVIVTSRSEETSFDFVSRFFAPAAGVNEDPVTGSAHCALGPYWRTKLGKADFTAFQASDRGGVVRLSVREDRVILRGQAVMMSKIELQHAPF
jgi:PhzF family phenazine biosynthesis protein